MTIIRPPCGSLTNAQARYIHDTLGYTFATWVHSLCCVECGSLTVRGVGRWAIDSLDWTGIDLPQKVNVVMNAYNDLPSGSSAIILHHDGYYTMPGAQGILDFCAARFAGYDFVTIEECLAQCHALGACKASGSALPCVFDS
ncbi:Chitin-binding type-1 domain-containing protein [Plasmodiophora brassicae]